MDWCSSCLFAFICKDGKSLFERLPIILYIFQKSFHIGNLEDEPKKEKV